MQIITLVAGWCLLLSWPGWLPDLVGQPCVSYAGCLGGGACPLPGFHLFQKSGTECPNIHAQKYVIIEMLVHV